MAIDKSLLNGVSDGTSPETVRVYGWKPPAVSIGYSQAVEKELDLEAIRAACVDVVRRPTGGRAVYHSGELTYSVAGRAGAWPLGRTISEAYGAIAQALLAGLAGMGIEASLAPASAGTDGRGPGPSPPCFVSSGRFEIVVDGRKLIGSAQRRSKGGVLQHGSLLVDSTHERLADFLLVGSEREREALRRLLSDMTTDLSVLLGGHVGFERVAYAIRSGFREAWGIDPREGSLSSEELKLAGRLASGYRAIH